MSAAVSLEGPADAELISAVRGGDVDAYGHLFSRHVEAARRLARQLTSPADADDLVSDAFAKVLGVLQRGGGPDVAFRAYLLTSVRRLHVDRIRATSRLTTTDDLEPFDPGVPFEDTAVSGFENAAAAAAFASLPERWQLVLWHTEVEGQKPADVAQLLGMSANSVSALAYRAREGLRQAFLTQHASELDEDSCRWTHSHLGAYVRDGVSRRDRARIEAHLQECRQCMAVYLELTEVNNNLGAILGPLLLGAAAAGYVGASAGGVGGTVTSIVGRAKDFLGANVGVSAAASVATIAAITSISVVALQQAPRQLVGGDEPIAVIGSSSDPTTFTSERPRVTVSLTPGRPTSSDSSDPLDPSDAVATTTADVTDEPTVGVTTLPTATDDPTDDTTDDPTSDPTTGEPTDPTTGPTDPTTGPTDPTTGPTDPTTGPTDPTTGPTDPTTGPTDPTTGPTDPTTGPTDPTTGPTDPTTGPTDPTTGPTDPTTGPTDPDPTEVDLAVTAVARPTGNPGNPYPVDIAVSGLPAGSTSTLTISASGVNVFRTDSPGCQVLGVNQIQCVVSGDPASFTIVVFPPADTVLEAAVTTPDGYTDTDPSNNVVTIALPSALPHGQDE